MFQQLLEIHRRPTPFECYTAAELWTDEHISARMLGFHLDGSIDVSSRRTEFIERSVGWIVSRFGLSEGKSVADFGCGPGLYTTRLALTGADITGIDFSERSIRHARDLSQGQGVVVDHVQGNYLEFESGKRFDLITMIMCDFCALSPGQRGSLLDKFRMLLKPGGNLLLDVYSLRAFEEREERATCAPDLMDGFWSGAPYFAFWNTFKYEAEKVVLDKYTIIEEARTRVIYNWLQCYDPEALTGEIEEHGLTLVEVLGDVAGAPFDPVSQEFAAIARKSIGAA